MSNRDYAHYLPYFKRIEHCIAGEEPLRGNSRPQILERGPATNLLFKAFFETVQPADYPITPDVNGFKQEGFSAIDRSIHRGHRLSAARLSAPDQKPREPHRGNTWLCHPDLVRWCKSSWR